MKSNEREKSCLGTVSLATSSIQRPDENWVAENFPWKSNVDRRELWSSRKDLHTTKIPRQSVHGNTNTYG